MGLSFRILLTLNQDTKKSLETPTFEKTLEKSSRFITDITEYYGYYGNRYYGILRNITVRNISPPWYIHEHGQSKIMWQSLVQPIF